MKIEIDLPDYEDGIDVFWDTDAKMSLHLEENHMVLSMNNVALLSLAKQLIYLSQDSVPEFSHIHYDNFTFDGFLSNRELVVVKKE
ncbi:MAG: hypothetical protein IKC61_04135 [Clostridia bacterium]|jgi:hypothetical protein|nr:hypothetical protein [Clostridia bacterium]